MSARARFVSRAAEIVGPAAAATVVAAIDGVIRDALVRGENDPATLGLSVQQLLRPGAAGNG